MDATVVIGGSYLHHKRAYVDLDEHTMEDAYLSFLCQFHFIRNKKKTEHWHRGGGGGSLKIANFFSLG